MTKSEREQFERILRMSKKKLEERCGSGTDNPDFAYAAGHYRAMTNVAILLGYTYDDIMTICNISCDDLPSY